MYKIILILVLVSSSIFGDQFSYNEKSVALKAAKFLKSEKEISFYCAPCEDREIKTEQIQNIKLKRTVSSDVEYYIVKVNNQEIDLAYTYVKRGNAYKNLAIILGLNPSDVPATIKEPPPKKPTGRPTVDSIDGIEIE